MQYSFAGRIGQAMAAFTRQTFDQRAKRAQIGFADPAGQRPVARTKVHFCRQYLLDADRIAARALEGRGQPQQNRRRAAGCPAGRWRSGWGAQDTAKGVTRQLQEPADLA